MKTTPPRFRTGQQTYVADRCQPLINAVQQGKLNLVALAREGYPGQPLRRSELPGVLSIGSWNAMGTQDWGLTTHCNEGIELTYLETGAMPFRVNNRRHTLKPGSLTITRPWQPHSLGNPTIGAGKLHWLILDVGVKRPHQSWAWPKWFVMTRSDLKRLTTLLRQNETAVWNAERYVASCFRRIDEVTQSPARALTISRLAVLINDLFLSLFDMLTRRRISLRPELTSTQRTVELFLNHLKEEPERVSQEWTSEAMAQHCDMGVTHFTELCRKLTNMTPMQYLTYWRVEVAAQRLTTHPEQRVTDIAFACGFHSSQYFATVFKKLKGCSPKQYRHDSLR